MRSRSHITVCFLVYLFLLLPFSPVSGVVRADHEKPVQRLVSLGPINTENVYLLGAGDRLVGNTTYCVRPEQAKTVEKVGSVMQFSIEKIISLQPDLVLATGLTRPQQVKKLQEHGLRTVHFAQPKSFKEICEQFLRLGRMLNMEERAQEIVTRAEERVARVKRLTADRPRQRVFLQVGSQPLFSSVESSFTNDFILFSGGINIAGSRSSGIINYEQVITENPEVIIIAIMGSENGTAAKEKENWQRIPVLDAVEKNRVFIINPDLVCSPSPVTFADTLEIIAKLIHPEIGYRQTRH